MSVVQGAAQVERRARVDPRVASGDVRCGTQGRGARRRGAFLLGLGLVGCGPSEVERHEVAVRLTVSSARVERRIAEHERRLQQFEPRRKPDPEPVPSQYGPGDFPTHPREPRWAPTAAPGEERSPREPQPAVPAR